jgi:hypothetical protein
VSDEQHYYQGYRILIERRGNGWRSTIFPPNGAQGIPGPQSDNLTSRKGILVDAQRLIDRHSV